MANPLPVRVIVTGNLFPPHNDRYTFSKTDTVLQVKQRISEMERVPPERMELHKMTGQPPFGLMMADHRTLASYGVRPGNVLQVFFYVHEDGDEIFVRAKRRNAHPRINADDF
ncbi:hypothetical protein BAUCODRAFT_152792 [Baudoinia panamericana UAMH 10762]|uniref:Ubiquitin-like domain-containing protein n=1 Tax=Baudoinia panamericana (strain UAMH 10762) TaxID=717646 RepID=M2MWI2_BAUPA|nr:uncharacterized protein BAUCODRAFT_152792 [Baudoinia panamericana UAMH 10762]EMC90944.1 hypothetical protein BAUCODRAFT_152792 [Baudoinia panamericana UAMH 10762]